MGLSPFCELLRTYVCAQRTYASIKILVRIKIAHQKKILRTKKKIAHQKKNCAPKKIFAHQKKNAHLILDAHQNFKTNYHHHG
jgi:hypothetical protein